MQAEAWQRWGREGNTGQAHTTQAFPLHLRVPLSLSCQPSPLPWAPPSLWVMVWVPHLGQCFTKSQGQEHGWTARVPDTWVNALPSTTSGQAWPTVHVTGPQPKVPSAQPGTLCAPGCQRRQDNPASIHHGMIGPRLWPLGSHRKPLACLLWLQKSPGEQQMETAGGNGPNKVLAALSLSAALPGRNL